MAQEIERKYLVNNEQWRQLQKPAGMFCRQGYLLNDPAKVIRVRIMDTKGFLTIKGATAGIARDEYEYEIPAADAKEMPDKYSTSEISKTRYVININDHIWEVDEFSGENEGLIVAEIELGSIDEQVDPPSWTEKEVSHDERYFNSNLAVNPFRNW